MMLATPVRSSEWSSTTSTRARTRATAAGATSASVVAIGGPPGRTSRPVPCPADPAGGAGARGGDERQRGADALGPLAHARHAETAGAAITRDAAAIVGHRQQESDPANGARAHHDAAGGCLGPPAGPRRP